MKPKILWLFLTLTLIGLVVFAAEPRTQPKIPFTEEKAELPVLKVFIANDGKARFVAYSVDWKGSEVIVSDILAESNYKVGEKIPISAVKLNVSETISTLSFLLDRPAKK